MAKEVKANPRVMAVIVPAATLNELKDVMFMEVNGTHLLIVPPRDSRAHLRRQDHTAPYLSHQLPNPK
eukprot:4235304-Pyramimonas_sp.AAC.1